MADFSTKLPHTVLGKAIDMQGRIHMALTPAEDLDVREVRRHSEFDVDLAIWQVCDRFTGNLYATVIEGDTCDFDRHWRAVGALLVC